MRCTSRSLITLLATLSTLAACSSNASRPGASTAPTLSASLAAASPSVSGASGSFFGSTDAVLAALAARGGMNCRNPHTLPTSGITGATSGVVCSARTLDNTQIIIFDNHADVLAWQAAEVVAGQPDDYIAGSNWGIAMPAIDAWFVLKRLGGQGASPTNPPAASAPPPVDLPEFDQPGSGADCVMTYAATANGETLTLFTFTTAGEIITHVADKSGNTHRNDDNVHAGTVDFIYDVPLNQIGDMGAVFYPSGAQSQSCTIKAANS